MFYLYSLFFLDQYPSTKMVVPDIQLTTHRPDTYLFEGTDLFGEPETSVQSSTQLVPTPESAASTVESVGIFAQSDEPFTIAQISSAPTTHVTSRTADVGISDSGRGSSTTFESADPSSSETAAIVESVRRGGVAGIEETTRHSVILLSKASVNNFVSTTSADLLAEQSTEQSTFPDTFLDELATDPATSSAATTESSFTSGTRRSCKRAS